MSTAKVTQRDMHVSVGAIGTIAASNTAIVRARVNGELKAIYFKEGHFVRTGDVMALIDPQPYQIALAQAQGAAERDQALLSNAKADLVRYQDLLATDAIPKQQLDTQKALVQQLQGTVQSDQAAVDSAKLQLSYTRVVAPISGLAGLKQADLGNLVQSTDPNGLVSITQTQPANVVFSVPQENLARIRQQLKLNAPMPVRAWDHDQKILLAQGHVASTDNAIDPTTGTIKIKAQFDNNDNSLFPNQFVNVRLQLDTLPGVLAVPSASIQRGAPGTFIYLVKEDGTVNLQVVKLGPTDGDWVAVEGNFKPGDSVVTDGADRLRDGAKVAIIEPNQGGVAGGAHGVHKEGKSGHHWPKAQAADAAASATQQ